MLIGLCGAHRTGKTTLAKHYAEHAKMKFLPTNASDVFKILGYSPKEEYPMEVVLDIQEAILRSFIDIWHDSWMSGEDAVTDRTPIDLIAYTLSHVKQDNLTDEVEDRLWEYIADCYEAANQYFGLFVVLLPAIDIEESDDKANTGEIYIDYISKLILGTVVDDCIEVPNYKIPQWCMDIDERVERVDAMVDITVKAYKKATKKVVKH